MNDTQIDRTLLPVTSNDAVILGMLMVLLGFVFWSSKRESGFWHRFYKVVPALLMCYFLPSLLTTFKIIDVEESQLYHVASRFLLPASLVLLTLSVDFKGIIGLGPKALIMFLTGTAGIVIGGPLAILIVGTISPETVGGEGPNAVWRGLSTVAGTWIGGGANQAAMKEIWEVGDEIFSTLVAVDVIIANIWMAFLLICAGRAKSIDRWNGADASAIDDLRDRVASYQSGIARIPALGDVMVVLAVGCGCTGLAHFGADIIAPTMDRLNERIAVDLSYYSLTSPFFWLIVLATTMGLILSATRARQLEGVGASRIGSVFIYVLVATIGLKMDLTAILNRFDLFVVGAIWMSIHAIMLIAMARIIRAPVFFMAVGSQANVGGAASAPVVASAFHPALAPVGVLLAVLGYALGTYAAWACGVLMKSVAPTTAAVAG